MTEDWLKREASGSLILSLHIQPGASRTAFAGLHGNALKIRLAAPPVDGKANQALLAFLAEELGVPKSQVEMIGGATSRLKRMRVREASEAMVAKLMAQAIRGQ